MPIYEFECRACGARFEKLCTMSSGGEGVTCPECGSADARRLISAFYSRSSGGGASSASGCSGCRKSSCAGCH